MVSLVQAREEGRSAKQFLVELYRRFSADRVMSISAGVTYYALLAIFPAVAAIVSVYGLFADANTIHADLASLTTILPGGAISIIGDQIRNIASKSHGSLGTALLIGVLLSLWSANSGMKSLFDALNIVLKEQERRSFVKLNLVSLAFTGTAVVLVLLGIAAIAVAPAVLSPLGGAPAAIVNFGWWPALWVPLALAIALIYRYGPSKQDIPWRWISWGSAIASILWIAASLAFSWYAANFGSFNKTYGTLGGVVGFMTWIWISVIVILIGQEVNDMLDARHRRVQRAQALPERS